VGSSPQTIVSVQHVSNAPFIPRPEEAWVFWRNPIKNLFLTLAAKPVYGHTMKSIEYNRTTGVSTYEHNGVTFRCDPQTIVDLLFS
jgi:archaellum biogenesis ATPase FlaH